MDGPEAPYREKFEKLATRKGEIVALVSSSRGKLFALTEKDLLDNYNEAAAHNATMSDDLKEGSQQLMEVDLESRTAIQAYKTKHGIPLDTPPVDPDTPTRFDAATNDPVYALDA